MTPSLKQKNLRYVILLGHLCNDINQSALPALLPFLITLHGFSYAQAASFVLVANVLSALIQPVVGWIGDKRECPWLMAVGVLLSCSGTSLVGMASSNVFIYIGAAVMGLGSAMFHPEGGRLANLAAGENKASGVAVFSVGGNLGFVLGPMLVAGFYFLFGMHGMALFLVPGLFCFTLLLTQNKAFCALSDLVREERAKEGGADDVGGFAICAASLSVKSIITYGLSTFIPLFFMDVLMRTENFSAAMLSIYSLAGVAATLIGGRLGDRWGYKKLLLITFVGYIPLIVLFTVSSSVPAALVAMIFIAFNGYLSFSSGTVLGQQFMPQHLGTASGILFGLTVSVGGIFSPLLGLAGDTWGVPAALFICVGVGLVGTVLATFIPRQNRKRAHKSE